MVPSQLPALTYSIRLYFENAFLFVYVCVYFLQKNNKFKFDDQKGPFAVSWLRYLDR